MKKLWNIEIRHLISPRRTSFNEVTAAGPNVFYAIGYLDLDRGFMERIVIDEVNTGAGGPRHQWQAKEGLWTPGRVAAFQRNGANFFRK